MKELTNRKRISRLLVVEDDEFQLQTLVAIMKAEGFEVIGCTSAIEALQHIHRNQFGVAIVDQQLPDLTGTQFLEKLKPLKDQVRVIIHTAYKSFDSAKDALNLGAFAFVEKGSDPSLLVREVRRAFHEQLDVYTEKLESAVAVRTKALLEINKKLRKEIGRRKQIENALRASEERFRLLYEHSPLGYQSLDEEGRIVTVNPAWLKMLSYSRDEVIGRCFCDFLSEQAKIEFESYFGRFRQVGEIISHQFEMVRKDGSLIDVQFDSKIDFDTDGQILQSYCILHDITEARRLSEQLIYQANHDSLTGLVNRAEFERRLKRVIGTARADRSEHAVCYMDLDQFKVINDTCGHLAGDELLRQVAILLQSQIRKRDTLARLGGDEFGILMEHCSIQDAIRVAEAIRKTVSDFRFVWQERNFSIGVSIGVVPVNTAAVNRDELLKQADAACYMAKEKGRNRIHVYHLDDAELAKRQGEMQWISRIHYALEKDDFRLYVQPIIPINAEGKEHCELLLRMRDEAGDMILPGAFLSAAGRYNLSPKIDRWVIKKAFQWLAGQPQSERKFSLCAINISSHSLGDEDLLEFIMHQFQSTDVQPEEICFEITETAAISNLAHATGFINALKSQGCQISLDDFGSGFSSFTYLKNLPVDFLKIDGTLIKDIQDDPVDLAIVKSINEIGRLMGIKTIAEFVENEETLKKLREMGVDYAQGFILGRPGMIH